MIPGLDGLMGAAGKMMEMMKGLESLGQGGQQGGGQGGGEKASGEKGGMGLEELIKLLSQLAGDNASPDQLKQDAAGGKGLGEMLKQGDSKGSIEMPS